MEEEALTWYDGNMPELTPIADLPPLMRHDWKQWADGQWRTFHQSVDFPGQTPRQFYECACKYANRKGLGFTGRIRGDRVFLQMWPKEGTDDARGDTTATPQPTPQ